MTDVSFSERPKLYPKIYAYEDSNPKYSGLLKIGYTTIDVDKRLEQQGKTLYFARVREMRGLCLATKFSKETCEWKERRQRG